MQVEKPAKSIDFPKIEHEILKKWDEENTFQKSISQRSAHKKYNFYDGPPFATGLPHFGHFVPNSIKDAFPRYFTMKGYQVERRFGWDCHGVPVELLVQEKLGLKGKLEIESYGIAKFNQACRASVLRYTQQWRNYIRRLGRWVDMENEYRTMDLPFMESVWGVLKRLWEKNLVYEDKCVLSYSTALGTTLSNFEASLNYRNIQDPSLTIKVSLLGDTHVQKKLLVWTTTPWTLPANVAIAIDPALVYAEVFDLPTQETYYLAKNRIPAYWPHPNSFQLVREFLGSELENVAYTPLFDSWTSVANENSFRIYAADYILKDVGTGAVHTAPAFGEDDFQTAKKYGLPLIDHLDSNGKYQCGNLPELVGLHFKEGDKIIIAELKKRKTVFSHETLWHSYPHCYRSGSPLMYRAVPSWFVRVEAHKELFQKTNTQIHWVPDHLKTGRFGKWLENARDWNIGRSRYWGNPLPLWKNDDTQEELCLGSRDELEKYTHHKPNDLHMEFLDNLLIPSQKHPGTFLKRVPFVLDCWFESGSMPYAAQGLLKNDSPPQNFPADFICEGLDQTRGWFYTLHLLSSLLFQQPAFQHVVVNGLVLAEDGRKMSKSLKNYPDPMETLETFGADSVRLFLLSSPATTAEEVRFSIEGVKESTRRILLPLWNAYAFFATYAHVDKWDPEIHFQNSTHLLDRWILLQSNELIKKVDNAMTSYEIAKVAPALIDFFDHLNNWYIRQCRRRFWESDFQAYSTLYTVLLHATKILAPFAPFAAEYFFGKLALTSQTSEESVHLSFLPTSQELTAQDREILEEVALSRQVVDLGRTIRVNHKIKNRQPLQKLTVGVLSSRLGEKILKHQKIICQELNIKQLYVSLEPSQLANIFVKPNFKKLGKTLGPRLKELQHLLADLSQSDALKALRKETIHVKDFVLTPDAITVELRPNGNQLIATDCELVVAIDPQITDALKQEGLARELVSAIQKARKLADFRVDERVNLMISPIHNHHQYSLKLFIENNRAFLEEETLSTLVETFSPAGQVDFSTTTDWGEDKDALFVLSFQKTANK